MSILSNNTRMAKDTVLYMIAKSFEGIVGIVTISVLSYIFSKEMYGSYALWNMSATIVAMLAVQWLAQSSSRYLNDYELKSDNETFYSTVFFGWLRINAAAVSIAALCGILLYSGGAKAIPKFLGYLYVYDSQTVTLFFLAVAYFMSYNTSQLITALLSVKRKAGTNLVLSVFSSAGKLALIFTFSRIIGAKLQIIFLSYIICDIIVIIVGFWVLAAMRYIRRKNSSKELYGRFWSFGAPLVGNIATTTVLNNSDRFIMENYLTDADVGTYSTSYSIVSAAFTMLSTALMRGSYPTILKTYAQGDKEQTERLISQAIRNYLLFAVPAVVGIGVLAKPILTLLLEESYVESYGVMVWVALGMMFLGLTEYSNKPWELSAKTWYIFKNSLISGIINLSINIIFVPKYGYMVAAYSTFIGFFVYFCLSRWGSRKLMKWHVTLKTYLSIIGSAAIMGFSVWLSMNYLGNSRLMLFVYIFIGIFVYGIAISATGETKEEIAIIRNFIKRRAEK